MTRNIIQKDHAEQEQSGTQQIQNHIAHRRKRCPADLSNDHKSAGCKCHDLEKYISGEDIICPDHGHQSSRQQIDECEIQIDLRLIDIHHQKFPSAHNAAEYNNQETECKGSFQNARADLVAPRRRKFTHRVCEGISRPVSVPEHEGYKYYEKTLINQSVIFCCFPLKHRTENARKKAQYNGKERKVSYYIHVICPPSDVSTEYRHHQDSGCDNACISGSSGKA